MTGDLFTGLKASFEDILGKNAKTFSEAVRRQRWAAWILTARRERKPDIARLWLEHECHGCKHRRGAWCTLQGLPCTVNPVLSFRRGMVGMACMGTGFDRQMSETIEETAERPDTLDIERNDAHE